MAKIYLSIGIYYTALVETVENLIEEIKELRAKLNQAVSFDEVTNCWQNLKKTYEKCSKMVEKVETDLAKLDENKQELTEEQVKEFEQMSFSIALAKMDEIAYKIKTATISEIPDLMSKMQILKIFCFKKLDEEKIKMEEIK